MRSTLVRVFIYGLSTLSLAFSQELPKSAPPPPAALNSVLSRAAEEAAVFQQSIVKTLSLETLEQHASLGPPRFQPRAGQKAVQVPPAKARTRSIVSEYSVGALKDSTSNDLVEFRQVVSVDGKPLRSRSAARHALSLGLQSTDDRLRKRMLEDFASHGLVDIATDYALILLAFSHRGIVNMQFREEAPLQVGADTVRCIDWAQTTSAGGELQFHGRQFTRLPLSGRLLVRATDSMPLAIETWAETVDNKQRIRDEAVVSYKMSDHGFLTPTSVVHRHIVNGFLTAENHYTYEPFRMFGADAEITFTELPAAPPPPPTKK